MQQFASTLRKKYSGNSPLSKALVAVYVVATISGLRIIYPSHPHEALGISLTILGFIALFLVNLLQDNNYIVGIGKQLSRLDERQLQVRRRIFEKSYTLSAAIVSIGLYLLIARNQSIQFHSSRLSDPAFWFLLDVVTLFLVLPSLFAAWEKDS